MNKVIVIGTSAGGLVALSTLLAGLPADLPAAVIIVMHVGSHRSELPQLLARKSALPVSYARDQQELTAGTVVVAPPDRHLLVTRSGTGLRTALTNTAKENHTRPAIDPLFRSAAAAMDGQTIGVILTGYLDDGVAGLLAIKSCGGTVIVQDPNEATVPDMPRNAIQQVDVDLCLALAEISAALVRYAQEPPRPPRSSAKPEWVVVENHFAFGAGNMEELARVATPSIFSCTECGGVLFEMKQTPMRRYRCHTGHSFSELALLDDQHRAIEEALRTALRALHEKERLAEQMAADLSGRGTAPDPGYATMAREAREMAEKLRGLLLEQPDQWL